MWSSFAGVVVGVRDLAAAEAGYASLLGLRPAWSGVRLGGGGASSGFALSNALVELRAPAGSGREAGALLQRIETRGEGLVAVALATDDLSRCARELRDRGIALDPGAPPAEPGAAPFEGSLGVPESATRGVPVLVVGSSQAARSAGPAGEASVGALDHVVVASRDPDASAAVWGGALGLRLALDGRFEARGLRILFFRLAGVTVEITGPLDATETGDPLDSFFGVAWRVADVDAAQARLAAAGFDVSEVRAGHKPGSRVCTVRSGTCGVATLLIGPSPS